MLSYDGFQAWCWDSWGQLGAAGGRGHLFEVVQEESMGVGREAELGEQCHL